MTLAAQLLVIAKQPLPGRSKTRLTPPLTPQDAARVARASLLDTLDAVAATDVLSRTVVLDGDPTGLVPPGFHVVPQVTGGLGDRLDAAFRASHDARPLPALLIGMDTPQVTPALLTSALEALLSPGTDAVVGLATDGGWWALGLHHPCAAFEGVPMSTATTGEAQRRRLDALGLQTVALPVLRDIDVVEDLHAVADALPPDAWLAALVRQLGVPA